MIMQASPRAVEDAGVPVVPVGVLKRNSAAQEMLPIVRKKFMNLFFVPFRSAIDDNNGEMMATISIATASA
jgi:hypothetical protein